MPTKFMTLTSLLILLFCTMSVAEFNPTIDQDCVVPMIRSSNYEALDLNIETDGIKFLWIESKGVYESPPSWSYSIDGDYAPFADAVRQYVQLDVLYDNPFTSDDLVGYKVVIISIGANWYGSFTSDEAAALAEFVQDGGGLFLMGDNPGCPNDNINGIAAYFDMTFGTGNADYATQYVTVPGFTHLVMETLATGTIGGSAKDWLEDGSSLVTGRYDLDGRGRVIGLGDINAYAEAWGLQDNTEILENIFKFLLRMIP